MTEPAVLDLEHLRTYTLGDAALETQLFGLFREQCALWAKALDPTGEAEAWASAAHALKGSAKAVGAMALAAACEHAETLAGAGGTPVARSVALQDIRAAIDAALIAVAKLDQRASSSFRSASQASNS